MITLKELSFEPDNFSNNNIKPIRFKKGLNFIIGEKSENLTDIEGRKMNGVGKSILIEAINFCLLKDIKDSRINKIPIIDLNDSVYICLSLEVEFENSIKEIKIKRSRDGKIPILIIEDGHENSFEKIDDAEKYLENLFFLDEIETKPSMRSMLSILLREEKTSYADILRPYGKSGVFGFAQLVKPHLFLFRFDLLLIDNIKKVFAKHGRTEKMISSINADFKSEGVNPSEVKAYLNDLEDKVSKLDIAVDSLKPSEGANQIHEELNSLILELENLTEIRSAKDYAIEKIKRLPKTEKFPIDEIRIVYNKYKEGLGDIVQKSFEQVLSFQNQIERFQTQLMTEKLKTLNADVLDLSQKIQVIDTKISKIYGKTNIKSKINDLRETVKLHREKGEKLERLQGRFSMLEENKEEEKSLNIEISELLTKIDNEVFEHSKVIQDFENDLKEIHDFIQGNKTCQFDITVDYKKKDFIKFDYRINLDGSSGINRIKVFMYDVLLMLNNFTSKKHFGFVIHDNIFASTGRDDMVRSLNFLADQESKGKKFQYIVTINKDEFDSKVKEFTFDYEENTSVELTREHPFLERVYSEL